jgi:hypothetical protein
LLPRSPINLSCFVKLGTEDVFHARYLQTDSRVFRCDPGFDFFDGKDFRPRIMIDIDENGRKAIDRIKKLPDVPRVSRFNLNLT